MSSLERIIQMKFKTIIIRHFLCSITQLCWYYWLIMHLMCFKFEVLVKQVSFILVLWFCYHVPLNCHKFKHVNLLSSFWEILVNFIAVLPESKIKRKCTGNNRNQWMGFVVPHIGVDSANRYLSIDVDDWPAECMVIVSNVCDKIWSRKDFLWLKVISSWDKVLPDKDFLKNSN